MACHDARCAHCSSGAPGATHGMPDTLPHAATPLPRLSCGPPLVLRPPPLARRYVDEVNLLDDGLVDVVLDSGAGRGLPLPLPLPLLRLRLRLLLLLPLPLLLVAWLLVRGGRDLARACPCCSSACVPRPRAGSPCSLACGRCALEHSHGYRRHACLMPAACLPHARRRPPRCPTLLRPAQPRAGRTRWSARASPSCTPPSSS